MHMPDHGYRPAYNGQFASDPQTQVIIAVDLDTTGSDSGLMAPMQDQIAETYGRVPQQYLVDGGFSKLDDIERAHAPASRCFAPPPNNGPDDPFAARKADGPGTAAGASGWRARRARRCIAIASRQVRYRSAARAAIRASAGARPGEGAGGAAVVRGVA